MPCRVGITTNLATRKTQWMSKVYGFRNWRLLAKFRSREKAQAYETMYANKHRCNSGHGGKDAPGN